MTIRFVFPWMMTLISAPLAFGQSWMVLPNGQSVVYPSSVYSTVNTPPGAVWRESFNGCSVHPVQTVSYPTAAYGVPAYGTTRQVYYTSAVPTTNGCASSMTMNYSPAPMHAAQHVHYASMPVMAGGPPNYGYNSGASSQYYVGYGLFGQPKAFGRNEPVRNVLRYLLP